MRRKNFTLIILITVPFVIAGIIFLIRYTNDSETPPGLDPLSIEGVQRVLILAPHCDDETLSSAGLIQNALAQKAEVKVVIATNGDGFLFATEEEARKLYPTAKDFIHIGNIRQQESLRALEILGVTANQVIFLSYPDRGTPLLWNKNWTSNNPYTSPYSHASKSPYSITYNPDAVYSGESYLADLISIFKDYQPDLIIYPHPDDVHPDHWGLSAFTRLALTLVQHAKPDYRPQTLTYLVHRPDYPEPKGYLPQASLVPPSALLTASNTWWSLGLSQDQVIQKEKAVQQYKTQLPLLRGLMESFIRKNELFATSQPAVLKVLHSGDVYDPITWRDGQDQPIKPVQGDPVKDYISRDVIPAGDLVALYVSQTPDGSLVMCSQVDGESSPALTYTSRLLAMSDNQIIHYTARNNHLESGWQTSVLKGRFVCSTTTLEALGSPWGFFVGAEVEEFGADVIDRIAWQMVFVEPDKLTGSIVP